MENNSHQQKNKEIIASNSHDYSVAKERRGFDFDLNEPIINTYTTKVSPPPIDINLVPISEVCGDNNFLMTMEGCQPQDMPLASPTQQIHSFNEENTVNFPFDLNYSLEEDEKLPFSNETKLAESASIDNIINDFEAITPDVAANQDRAGAVKGGSGSRNSRKRKRSLGGSEKGAFHWEKVAVQNDGYHWRKYGQKTIKGSLFPRAYYKCTKEGCSVKKHVERNSHNTNKVITTYGGVHNHEQPLHLHTDQKHHEDKKEAHNYFGSFNNNINIGSFSYTYHLLSSVLNNANTIPYRSYGLNPAPQHSVSMFPFSGGFFQNRVNADGSSSVFPFGATGARVKF